MNTADLLLYILEAPNIFGLDYTILENRVKASCWD